MFFLFVFEKADVFSLSSEIHQGKVEQSIKFFLPSIYFIKWVRPNWDKPITQTNTTQTENKVQAHSRTT